MFGLLTVCVGCLATGLLLGFPYNFARLPLGIAGIYSFGVGLMEIGFKRPGFPHLLYVYDFRMGLDYVWVGAESAVWQLAGILKVLLAIGIMATFLVASRHRKALGGS